MHSRSKWWNPVLQPVYWHDNHVHLDGSLHAWPSLDADSIVAAGIAANVTHQVAVSMNLASMRHALQAAQRWPGVVRAALGIHPECVSAQTDAENAAALAYMSEHVRDATQIGEIGLDGPAAAADPGGLERQRAWLHRQFALAQSASLPVNMHGRGAADAALDEAVRFRASSPCGVVLHWFTGSKRRARIAADKGVFISVGPSVLHDPSTKAVVAAISTDLLLLETDTPVQFPGSTPPYAPAPSTPALIPEVAKEVARIKSLSVPKLNHILVSNHARFRYGWP